MENTKQYLSKEEFRELCALAQAGDINARNIIVERNLGLINKAIAMTEIPIHVQKEDLQQEGVLGLIRAIELFDLQTDYSFSTYAMNWIRNKIHLLLHQYDTDFTFPRNVKSDIAKISNIIKQYNTKGEELTDEKLAKIAKLPVAKIKEYKKYLYGLARLDKPALTTDADNPTTICDMVTYNEDGYEEKELELCNSEFREVIKKILTEKELDVIQMHFGLEPYNKIYKLEEIGQKYNVSKERIRQIEVASMRKLRHSREIRKYNYT